MIELKARKIDKQFIVKEYNLTNGFELSISFSFEPENDGYRFNATNGVADSSKERYWSGFMSREYVEKDGDIDSGAIKHMVQYICNEFLKKTSAGDGTDASKINTKRPLPGKESEWGVELDEEDIEEEEKVKADGDMMSQHRALLETKEKQNLQHMIDMKRNIDTVFSQNPYAPGSIYLSSDQKKKSFWQKIRGKKT